MFFVFFSDNHEALQAVLLIHVGYIYLVYKYILKLYFIHILYITVPYYIIYIVYLCFLDGSPL